MLPPEQGEILVNGILVETGAIQIAGDARSTSSRKTNFPIWLGRPTAGPVSEGAAKGVTGASFGQSSLNVQKFASIVLFTDEQIEDLQNGDLNVLVDAGVRQALSVSTDAHAVGLSAGQPVTTVFDSALGACTPGVGVTLGSDTIANVDDTLQKAVSAAMGQLEANGYGNPSDMGVLIGFGFQQKLRDARDIQGRPLYDGGTYAGQAIDALYGLDRAHSTNLPSTTQDRTATGTLTSSGALFSISASPNNNVAVVPGAPISGTGLPAGSFIGPVVSGGPLPGTPITGTIVKADGTLQTVTTESAETLTLPQIVGCVAHKPNIHVRVRQDVTVGVSNEASIVNGGTTFNLFQENLTAIRYELRMGYLIHDLSRSVIPVFN